MIYIGIAGCYVRVEHSQIIDLATLKRDLRWFFDFQVMLPIGATEVASVVCGGPKKNAPYNEDQLRQAQYRDIVMRYPADPKNRTFGRLAHRDGVDVIFDTTKGSLLLCDERSRVIRLFHDDPIAGAKELRRVVRDQLLMFYHESEGAIVAHSSLLDLDNKGVLVVGARGSGKSTFFMVAQRIKNSCGLCNEKSMLLQIDQRNVAYALPEKINFFPGTLASFPETRHLVPGVEEEKYWRREHKFFVHHTLIEKAFGTKYRRGNGIEIEHILFPKYSSIFNVSSLSPIEVWTRLAPEVLTGSDPAAHANWLSWFHSRQIDRQQLLKNLTTIPADYVEWRDVNDIENVFGRLFGRRN